MIHPTAIIEDGAIVGLGTKIGPYCHIGSEVRIGEHCHLISHVVVAGRTVIGSGTQIYPFASIGHQPQDLKYAGESNELRIGKQCVLREHVTINPGTKGGGGITQIGNHCCFLTSSHVGHDCTIGNSVILSNNVMIAGHCCIEDHVIFGGGAAIIQFGRVGSYAFVGGLTGLEGDCIPFGTVIGNRARLCGLNLVGMKRGGFSREHINETQQAYRQLFSSKGTLHDRLDQVNATYGEHPLISQIIRFMSQKSKRPLCLPEAI